jgi:hypothetical protein
MINRRKCELFLTIPTEIPCGDLPLPDQFPIYPGAEVRLATDHERSNGKLGRVVSLHPWGAVLETNFATHSYRAAWHEMEPIPPTDLVNPHSNGNGYHTPNGVLPPVVKPSGNPSGKFCDDCGGLVVRTGMCETCQDCGRNEGCG